MSMIFRCNNCGSIVEIGKNGEGDRYTGYSCWEYGYVHYPMEGEHIEELS